MNARQNQSTPGPDSRPHDSLAGVVPQAPASACATTDVSLPCMEERTLERLTDVAGGTKSSDEAAERTRSISVAVTAPALVRAPFLVVLTGDHEGRVIRLPTQGTFEIGRAETC